MVETCADSRHTFCIKVTTTWSRIHLKVNILKTSQQETRCRNSENTAHQQWRTRVSQSHSFWCNNLRKHTVIRQAFQIIHRSVKSGYGYIQSFSTWQVLDILDTWKRFYPKLMTTQTYRNFVCCRFKYLMPPFIGFLKASENFGYYCGESTGGAWSVYRWNPRKKTQKYKYAEYGVPSVPDQGMLLCCSNCSFI